MNDLTVFGNTENMTMSSKDIADLVEKRHDVVKLSIERLVERGVISLPPMVEVKIQRERRDETVSVYQVGKRDSYIIVAQLSPEFTARLVDRWQELESRPSIDPMQVLSDPSAMRGLLLVYTEKVLALQSMVEHQAPKVEAFDRIATEAEGSMCITNAAKLLQVRPIDAFRWLSLNKWIFKRHGGSAWLGYQDKIQHGLLEMKVVTVERSDGTVKPTESVLITAKGLSKLAEIMKAEAA